MAHTVLVADDNLVNLSLMSDILEMKGLEVIRVRDGVEAVKLARTLAPDITLMDIQMPVMDGLEATNAEGRPGDSPDPGLCRDRPRHGRRCGPLSRDGM